MKKISSALLSMLMTGSLVLGLAGTGILAPSAAEASDAEEKILYVAEDFSYASLDPHKEYYGWMTSLYGLSETLFKMGDDSSVEPWLASDAALSDDGLTWTITLAEGAAFSNGEPVTAEMVIRNLQRAAEVNARFAYLAEYEMEAVDEQTLTITTPSVYPTMQNDLASPELAILDLDNTTDYDHAPIATGPFVVDTFEPEGTVTVAKNENYWGGEVKLDGAVFYYMQDDNTKLAAMQSGELDCYTSVTAAAVEIYSLDPDTYQLTVIPATRLQFYILNENTLSDNVRAAINLTVDAETIAAYLNGTVSATDGPFSSSTAYGQVEKAAVDTDAAKALLEEDGYVQNENGFYEKDGEELSLNLYYYASRSLDTLAILMQEQLKNIGVNVELYAEEDPDATYIASGDFDIALYCMISDKAGDPYYFIDSTLRDGAALNCGGFESEECESLIDELQYETDTDRRAELANEIVQMAIDDNAFGYVGLFNKTTVMRVGVSGFTETSPFDFYAIDADTDKAISE
ncbi:MAG: ABC transporter substrate-binding protein [Lachnospiraceae bacterium]|nr:ABC transporter substrate-binding protein [Lachnospiraceae bacterium]